MKVFFQKLGSFSLILVLLLSPLVLLNIGGKDMKYIDNPVAALIDKHKRVEQVNGPRLIIMGGSNAFYGMNSGTLSDSLDMHVINMALFAGFGLDFMLNELLDNIRQDDVVLLSVEYFLIAECHATSDIIKYYPRARKYLPKETPAQAFYDPYLNHFKVNIESLQNSVLTPVRRSSNIYVHSRTINEYGDAVGYLNYMKPPFPAIEKLKYRYYEGIQKLNRFRELAAAAGATVYFTFPPLPESDYKINEPVIEKYYADMKRDMKVPMISTPTDMVFSDSLFYDSHYHLDKNGRELRTNKLVTMLKKYVPVKKTMLAASTMK